MENMELNNNSILPAEEKTKNPEIKKNNILNLKNFITLSWCLLGVIILLLTFKAGMMVGFRKANFSLQWGQNYHQNFVGPRGNFFMSTFGPDEYTESSGAFGQIIKINKDSLVMTGVDNVEKIILLNDDTIIRSQRSNINADSLQVGENIVVIGEPTQNGEIQAKLIRIMPPAPGAIPMMFNGFPQRLF